MPIYEPDYVEYTVTTGHITIAMDDGVRLPAYWAHPQLGTKFPCVAVIHDWWGLTSMVRRLANLFAQMGHYVIVPDLFNSAIASTPQEAMRLVEQLGDDGYPYIHHALSVLETHHQSNHSVAAIGMGMGGSLAFEAAVTRDDLEVAVAYGGFPDRYLGRLRNCNTAICAFYGTEEPYVKVEEIARLRKELAESTVGMAHELHIVDGLGHDFFSDSFSDAQREKSREVLKKTLEFLDQHLESPTGFSNNPGA
jgi:carboxymethylenebutenolidase